MSAIAAQLPRRPTAPAHLAVALAAFAAVQSLARTQADPVGSSESAFLALMVGGVLVAIAVVAPRPSLELGWTAVLAVAAVWAVGYGPHRGALVSLVLIAGLVVAAGRAGVELLLAPGPSAGLALGVQLLARPDLLLAPLLDLRTVTSVAALPVAAGLALTLLARRFGTAPAWIAGAAAFVLSPGWNVTVTLALLAAAAGAELADASRPLPWRALAAAVLVVPPLWDATLGTLFTLGALTFMARGYAAYLIPVAAAILAFRTPPEQTSTELALFWAQGLVLMPALALAPPKGRPLVLRGLLLALFGALVGRGPEALAGGLVLAALGLGGGVPGLQRAWSNALALGTLVVASYPWLREEPLTEVLELVSLKTIPVALVAAFAVVPGLAWVLERWRGRRGVPRPAVWLAVLVVLALWQAMPTTAHVPVSFKPVTLDAERRPLFLSFPPQEVAGGTLDTHLVHGVGLELGAPVATVKLRDAGGRILAQWDILAGLHTAEWAAARRDIADRPGFMAPQPSLSQVALDGTFFAQRFRARFSLDAPVEAASIAVRRHEDLPSEVELVVYHLELRR